MHVGVWMHVFSFLCACVFFLGIQIFFVGILVFYPNMTSPTGQIYVCGIFMEHSQEIFPVYSEKFPVKFWVIFQNNVPGISNTVILSFNNFESATKYQDIL